MKQLKRALAFLLVVAMVITFIPEAAFLKAASTSTAEASSDSTYGFHVSGSKLLDANGNQFVMRGINNACTWYKDQSETAIKAIAETGSNTVRLVLSNGKQWNKDDLSSVKELIQLCKENKMIAVLEVHDATGSTSISDLLAAADYFVELKDALIGNEAYVIVNIANEWDGTSESATWKEGYISAVKEIRNAGIKNTIMVDAAGWGQYPASIAASGQAVFDADVLGNTMFSTHMYDYAGGNETTVKNNINAVAATGLCQVIGEFGWKHTSGDVDEDTIMSYCQEKAIGYLAWSWKGNSGGVEYLDLSNDWAGTDLSDWGERVVNGTNGIKQTAAVCSVFGESSAVTSTPSETGVTLSPSVSASEQPQTTSSASVTSQPSVQPDDSVINLYTGSLSASSWSSVLSISTVKDGGTLDSSMITQDGYFTVEYTGDKEGVQLVFQSWSGGAGWAQVYPSEITQTSSGTYLAKFNYSDISSVYGSKFDALDVLHLKTTTGAITLKSFDYHKSATSAETVTPSESTAPSETVTPSESAVPSQTVTPSESTAPSETVTPSESTAPSETVTPSESAVPSQTVTPSESAEPVNSSTVNFFCGSKEVGAWSGAAELTALKDSGTFDSSIITEDGYFTVTYTGTKDCLQMIFQSWSGGAGWAVVTPSEIITNSDGSYTAVFDYDTVTAVYGTKYSALDKIYVQTKDGSIVLKSFDYVTETPVVTSEVPVTVTPTATIAPTPSTTASSQPSGELLERTFQADDSHVKVIGRTCFNEKGQRWIANTASGIEFTFTGTKASVTILGDGIATATDASSSQARIAIYVNGELVEDDMLDEAEKTYNVFESTTTENVTIRIIKLSESASATAGIGNITVTSMGDIEPTAQKAHKVEFIGDSITCGYGVDDSNISGGFKNSTENGSKTYAYKTAAALDADYSIVSVSGFGIISGYTGTGQKNTNGLLPPYYDKLAYSWSAFGDGTSPSKTDWNFDEFQPDAVVINLGTNDNSYCGSDTAKQAEFVAGYVDFLKQVRAKNPNATIFCTLGIMGADLYPSIEKAVAQYTEETGDANVTSMQFDVQQMSDGICVDWHPSETTHTKAAAKLTAYMKEVMGW